MDKIKLVPTMKDTIEQNSAWCAAFEIAWKEFEENLLKNFFACPNKNEMINNLINASKQINNIDSKYYYVKSGKQTIKLKKEIINGIRRKFKTKSDVLDKITFEKDENTFNVLIYAMLYFKMKFEKEFDVFKNGRSFKNSDERYKYFGIIDNKKLLKQVEPLFYINDENFAIKLFGNDKKQIILYKTNFKDNFENIFNEIVQKTKDSIQHIVVKSFAVPNININIKEIYDELKGKEFIRNQDDMPFTITNAFQTLKLEMNESGAKAKSEAVIEILVTGCRPTNHNLNKDFIFDDTFYMYIVENGNPLVALRVNDIDNFGIKLNK